MIFAILICLIFLAEEFFRKIQISIISLAVLMAVFSFTSYTDLAMASLYLFIFSLCRAISYKVKWLKPWPFNLGSAALFFFLIMKYVIDFDYIAKWGFEFNQFNILSFFVLMLFSILGLFIYFKLKPFDPEVLPIKNLPQKWIMPAIVLGSIVNSLREEIPFRLLLFFPILALLGPMPAILIQSGIFAAMHFHDGFTKGWLGYAMTLFLGACLAYQVHVSGSLGLPIFTHAVIDVLLLLVIMKWYLPKDFLTTKD